MHKIIYKTNHIQHTLLSQILKGPGGEIRGLNRKCATLQISQLSEVFS